MVVITTFGSASKSGLLCDPHPGCLQCVQVGEGDGATAIQHLCSHFAKESFVMGLLTCSM